MVKPVSLHPPRGKLPVVSSLLSLLLSIAAVPSSGERSSQLRPRPRWCAVSGGGISDFTTALRAELDEEHSVSCANSPFETTTGEVATIVSAAHDDAFREKRLRGTLPDFHEALGASIFVSCEPYFSRDECRDVVARAEAHFSEGWTHLSTGRFSVCGDWIKNIPAVKTWFEEKLKQRLFPTLCRLFPEFASSPELLCVDSAYLFKYTAESGARTDVHTDSGCLSFTIALNPRDEYQGGGTWFEGLGDEGGSVLDMEQGVVTFRPGGLRHQGFEVTSGTRYVIGGFVVHRDRVEYCRRAVGKGTALAMEGKFSEAERVLRHAVEENSYFDGAWVCLADAQRNQGGDAKVQEAAKSLEKALELNPSNGEALFSLAGVRNELGQHAASLALYKQYLEDIEPSDIEALFDAATVLGTLSRHEEEVQMLRRLIVVAPAGHERQAAAYTNLGVALGELGDAAGEIESYEKAIAIEPGCKPAWYSLGSALASAGRLEEAALKYKHILAEIDPSDMASYNSLYRVNNMLRSQADTETEDF